MRVLLTSFPAVAHVLALRPLAAELVARGHDVALLSAPSAAPLLPPGVRHLVAGPDLDELLALPRPEGERPDGLPIDCGNFFGGQRVGVTLDAARAALGSWQADLVVAEGLDGLGPVLAAAWDVPLEVVSLGPVCMADIDADIRTTVLATGLPYASPRRRLDPWPAVLRPPGWEAPGPLTPVRAELALPDAGSVPVAVPPGDGPAVLVTLGTLFLDGPTLAGVVDAVTGSGARAVVALPPSLDALDVAHPDRVALRPFGALGPVLERVDAVVCHAGAATVLAAAIHGRPLVVVPQGADHHINAAGVVAAGIGLRVAATDGPGAIAAATTVVVGSGFCERAAGTAAGIAATPSWADLLA
ncbi:nucleotide disphospho-sugar-binding domain-containing protein [Actinomycetospora sp. NBRC 106378]|uniref:glycosyltransferase n=1 Tax=Actinomycetospora sp. NBRC 106378 TaxID=3032208 RepID=UPI0024A5EE4B|nr:nucleotide disphospho-sugar-binding domain-containing protein [Actinomycetospora sp. NBRC 106378]GLZ55508.1 glycosyl transferase [Actinomycetospora sp. NBRC 106378]